jgi:hypothetical protein
MPKPEVTTIGEGVMAHHLVRYETQSVSVDNTGMLHLGLTRPQDVDDLIAALEQAKEVGLKQQATNSTAQATADSRAQEAMRLRDEAMAQSRRVSAPRRPTSSRAAARGAAARQAAAAVQQPAQPQPSQPEQAASRATKRPAKKTAAKKTPAKKAAAKKATAKKATG